MSDDHLKLLVKFQDEARRMFSILCRSWTILLQTCIHKLFPQNEQRTLYGALVVTLATLLHLINCRFVIIIIYSNCSDTHCDTSDLAGFQHQMSNANQCLLKTSFFKNSRTFGRRRGSVVMASVFGWQTFPDLRLICGWHVTTLWVKCPLWVNQTGQLSLPSFQGQ